MPYKAPVALLVAIAATLTAMLLLTAPRHHRPPVGCTHDHAVGAGFCLHWVGWGHNVSGEIGAGFLSANPALPIQPVFTPAATTTIQGGSGANFALQPNGTVYAWGASYRGSLGNGTIEAFNVAKPQLVLNLSTVVEMAIGAFHPMVRLANHKVMVWGSDLFGEHGNGTTAEGIEGRENGAAAPYLEPTEVPGILANRVWSGSASNDFVETTEGKYMVWGASKGLCAGKKEESPSPVEVVGLPAGTVKRIIPAGEASTYGHDIILKTDGTVWTCGDNQFGQAGLGFHKQSIEYITEAKQVPGLSHIVQIAGSHTADLALTEGGTVYGWGEDDVGEVGAGTPETNCGDLKKTKCISTPVEVMTGVKAIAATHKTSLAVTTSGHVFGWGENTGALGSLTETEPITVPTEVPGLSGIDSLTCAASCTARARVIKPLPAYTITPGKNSLTIHWRFPGVLTGQWEWRVRPTSAPENEFSAYTKGASSATEATVTEWHGAPLAAGTSYTVGLEGNKWGSHTIEGVPE